MRDSGRIDDHDGAWGGRGATRGLLRPARWLAAGVVALLAVTAAPLPALADATNGDVTIGVDKTVVGADGTVPTFSPGDPVTYQIELECSSLTSGICLGAELTDAIPAPLQLQSVNVQPPGIASDDSDIAGNVVDVSFTQSNELGSGMLPGTAIIQVTVLVPADITWEEAQALGQIDNTATFTAAGLTDQSTAGILIDVPVELSADATKSADDNMAGTGRPIPAVPGMPVDFTIGGANTSNRPVDTITITDPAAGSSNMEYVDITSIGPVTPPAGADQFLFVYTDDTGTHQAGPYPAPTDSVPLDGIDASTITSVSFVFSNSTGTQLPPQTGPGDYASIGIATETNDLVSDLDPSESVVIDNVTETTVAVEGDTASDTAAASVTVENTPPGVTVTKQYLRNTLLPGESTTANIRADNGGKDVTEMTISDPGDGGANLAEQGLIFNGFDDDAIEWPDAADHVSVTYTYADGSEETLEGDVPQTIPASTHPEDVVGFSITFTGPIVAGAFASVPFDVTAMPVTGEDDVVTTNTVDADVTDADGGTAHDDDSDDMTRRPVRVHTDVEKNIVKDDIYSVPGASTLVQLTGRVSDDSSTGAEYLVVQDPADPEEGLSEFWNYFDLQSIGPVDVPQNASMTVEYWSYSQQDWVTVDVDPMPVPPGTTWSYTVPDDLKDDIAGIRFTFTPVPEGTLLQPGFNVLTYFNVGLRDDLRDGTGPAAGGSEDIVTIGNDAMSEVDNENTGQGPQTDTDDDSIDLLPVDGGGGPGPDLVEKSWTPDEVLALSGAPTAVDLSWGTMGIPMDTMTITDPTGADTLAIAQSVFDAFDLTSIDAIDSATDPGMLFDQVYAQRLSATTGTWVSFADGFTAASPSVGGYPRYVLTAAESADTVGVRFVFSERPDRADVITNIATDPAVGSGVAETDGRDRHITLRLELRDYLRSVPTQPVLGTTHAYGYNTGTAGNVLNTVDALGVRGDQEYEDTGQDDITILDRPMNVTVDKRFVDYDPGAPDPYTDSEDVEELPLPPDTAPQSDFPGVTALLRARNTSDTRVGTLTVTDPDPGETETIFDQFNLYAIPSVTVPQGADPALSRVILNPAVDGRTEFTIAEATALTPVQLAGVTSIRVVHSGAVAADGTFTTMIAANAFTDIRLEFQLRKFLRSDPAVPVAPTGGTPLVNHTIVEQTRPGVPATETITDTSQDDLTIADAQYGVETTKVITPDTRSETESPDGYQIALTGRPTGNVRTTLLQLTDATPTFWNAFEFASFQDVALPNPIDELRVDVLTGVDYAPGLLPNTLEQTCNGSVVLDDCWTEGSWITTTVGGTVTAAQIAASVAASPADVQGLRFSYRVTGSVHWERPSNPTVTASFVADRRAFLVYDGTDDGVPTEVPSTRPGLAPAPGEAQAGVFTDTVRADGVGSWELGIGLPYLALAFADDTTTLTHVPNGVSISKVHGREGAAVNEDTFYPGEDIPYSVTVVNTGGWPITGLTLTDQVETDAAGPMLVEPERDLGDETPIYTATHNGVAVDPFTGSMDASGLITFTFPDDFVLAPGDSLVVTAGLEFRQTPTPVAPGTDVTNGATVTSDRFFDTCDYTMQAVAQPTTQDVEACSSATDASPAAFSPIATDKSVRGVGAGAEGAQSGDANFDDLGVIGLLADDPTGFCAAPNAGSGYYRTPCVPITRPGGIEQWRLQLTNRGNIPVSTIATIDVLPHPGDTGVILAGTRDSRWAPVFLGSVSSSTPLPGATLQIWYSTEVPNGTCNEADIENETGGITPENASCTSEVENDRPDMWQPYSNDLPADVLAQVRALKIVASFVEGDELEPNSTIDLSFLTRTPWYSDQTELAQNGVDPIAWNSGASGSVGRSIDGDVQSQVIEPRKVGVAQATGQLQLEKTVEGIDEDWGIDFPDEYSLTLACTSGDEDVPLVGPNGEDLSDVRVAADGTPLVYNGGTGEWGIVTLPLYAQCTVSENADDPTSQGASVTYDPAGPDAGTSGAVEALRFAFADNVAHPADTADPSEATISVVNTYLPASLRLTKDVDNGGAVDHNGEPIIYGPFEASVACTFLGQPVWADGYTSSPMVVDIDAGETVTLEGLPAGAECTIAETDTDGAASVIMEGGNANGGGTGDESGITIILTPDGTAGEATNSDSILNLFGVGSLELHKAIDPVDSTFANGPYVVRVRCTLDGDTTWDGDVVFDAATDDPDTIDDDTDFDATIENIATGSSCAVVETDDAFADSSTVSPSPVTIGDGTAVVVTITNFFPEGSLTVTKVLEGDTTWAPASFTVTLRCTDPVSNAVLLTIPDGPTRELTEAGGYTATYNPLPAGALCLLTESDDGGAASSVIEDENGDPAGPFRVEGDVARSFAVVNTFEVGSLDVTKVTSGDGAALWGTSEFEVQLECTAVLDGVSTVIAGDDIPGGAVRTFAAGETVTYEQLPPGAVCTVTETGDGGASEHTISPTGGIVTVDADTPVEITVDNTFDVGSIAVTKRVTGDAAQWGDDGEFTVSLACTWDGSGTDVDIVIPGGPERVLSAANSFTATYDDLPDGAQCELTETDAAGASDTVITPNSGDPLVGTVTVAPNASVALDVENVFDAGSVRVVKTVSGDAAEIGGAYAFLVELSCTESLQGPPTPITIPGGAMRLLTAANSYTAIYTPLPNGAQCELREVNPGGATGVTITPNAGDPLVGSVVVGENQTAELAIENVFDAGDLHLLKVVDGEGAEFFGAGPFTVHVTCTLATGATGPLSTRTVVDEDVILGGDEPLEATITAIPVGAVCDIDETDDGVADASVVEPSSITIGDGQVAEVTITNTFLIGSVHVQKVVTGGGADEFGAGPFEVTVKCIDPANRFRVVEIPGGAERELSAAGDYEATYEALPVGALCGIAETDDGGADAKRLLDENGDEVGLISLDNGSSVGFFRVQDGVQRDFVLENTFDPPLPVTGGDLDDLPLWIGLVATLLGGGVILLLIGRRRRGDGEDAG